MILASATLAGAFGGALAYGIGYMNQIHGLEAWRWLFILEGLPSVFSALLVWFFLPDYPETAKWLSAEEKDVASHRMAEQGSQGNSGSLTWEDAKETLLEWRLWCHYLVGHACDISEFISNNIGRSTLASQPPFLACRFLLLPLQRDLGYVDCCLEPTT